MPVNPLIQEAMDTMRRLEYRLSQQTEQETKTAALAMGSCVSSFYRTMINSWGVDLQSLSNEVLRAESQVEVVIEHPETPTISDAGGVFEPATTLVATVKKK